MQAIKKSAEDSTSDDGPVLAYQPAASRGAVIIMNETKLFDDTVSMAPWYMNLQRHRNKQPKHVPDLDLLSKTL